MTEISGTQQSRLNKAVAVTEEQIQEAKRLAVEHFNQSDDPQAVELAILQALATNYLVQVTAMNRPK